MSPTYPIHLMAAYNAWINARLYEAAAKLPAEALAADRKAFFGSTLGTLKHLLVADRMSQSGIDIGVTDLLALIPDESGA